MSPEQHLCAGAIILAPYLNPLGFKFELKQTGSSSGGSFAYGEFSKGEAIRIELHFRYSLGLVSYHVYDFIVSHQDYIDLVGKHGQNKYPDFTVEPQNSFHSLLWDLQNLLIDFTERDGHFLKEKRQELIGKQQSNYDQEKKRYSGDQRLIDSARIEFKNGHYQKVDALRQQLRHPELLTSPERKLFVINIKKIIGQV